MAEKESIRLTARTGEFTRVSGACNGEFGGVAVSRNQVMIVRENLSVEATKNPTETSGFLAEKERFELSNRFSRLHDFQSCALDQLGDFSKRY